MKRLTITELEQIRQRAEAATGGNWFVAHGEDVMTENPSGSGDIHSIGYASNNDNALFISEAREAVPKLLTEVETLITEKAAARRMLDELIGEMANADEAGYALAPETVRSDLEKIRKELIDHGE